MLPCERISPHENRQCSQHRPQEVMPKKYYHVNVFSFIENVQFPRHRPQEVKQYLIYFSYVLLKEWRAQLGNVFNV